MAVTVFVTPQNTLDSSQRKGRWNDYCCKKLHLIKEDKQREAGRFGTFMPLHKLVNQINQFDYPNPCPWTQLCDQESEVPGVSVLSWWRLYRHLQYVSAARPRHITTQRVLLCCISYLSVLVDQKKLEKNIFLPKVMRSFCPMVDRNEILVWAFPK